MPKRSYRQNCALALALDRIGDRWTLLIIRELLTGPARFKDLLANLTGIGTNLLAARLRKLEAAGLLRRTTLPRPAGSPAYELTTEGRKLEPALVALAEWGLQFLQGPRKGWLYRPGWAVLAMKAAFNPRAARGVRETYEYRIDDEVFHARVEDGALTTARGPAWKPDMVLRTDAKTFLRLAIGELDASRAVRSGAVSVQGKPRTLARTARIFGVSKYPR